MRKILQQQFTRLLLLALLVGSGTMWGQTITIIPNASATGNSTNGYVSAETAFTSASINWKINNWNPTSLQMRGNNSTVSSNFYLSNTIALPGDITKITITNSNVTLVASKVFLLVGSDEQVAFANGTPAGTATTTANTVSWSPSAGNKFFKIYLTSGGTSGTALISNIKIEYTANQAPTATNVAVAGTTHVGDLLTGSYTYADANSDPQGTSTFKWYRADNASGLNATAIGGATASTYTLTTSDLSKFIRFGVVPVATTGTPTGSEAFSGWVGAVTSTTPTIAVSGTLTQTNTTYGAASAYSGFTASGVNLTNNIIINAPAGFEISTSQSSGYQTSLTLTPASGTVANTPIYVRLAATTAFGTYSGNITLQSSPADSKSIATVSSTVSKRPLTLTLSIESKPYDGTTAAILNGVPA